MYVVIFDLGVFHILFLHLDALLRMKTHSTVLGSDMPLPIVSYFISSMSETYPLESPNSFSRIASIRIDGRRDT